MTVQQNVREQSGAGTILREGASALAVRPTRSDALCLHETFEIQAQHSPTAPAAEYEGHSLTYAELDARANQLAQYLRGLDVGTETPVGVFLERSLHLPVALLAILKAGGSCVPLDPNYPPDRLALMMEDSGARLVLTDAATRTKLDATGVTVVDLDRDSAQIAKQSSRPLDAEITPANVAYIIYTSGSTGKPKGVLVLHAGLVNHGRAIVELYGHTSADRVLQFSSISFDIAIEEMFPTWMAGATVVIRPENLPLQGSEFLSWVDAHGITVLDMSTAYWHELVHELAEGGSALPPALRLVGVGGEKASSARFAEWRRIAGKRVRWINTYGPTEASVVVTAYEPPFPPAEVPDPLPIGRALGNVTIRLLDENLQPVANGQAGELHIGGVCLARGYLNRPEATAEKFIPDPFSTDPQARLYKTGDLARWLPSGDLEFAGRTDFQVKIRGFRVEPGEVEAALAQHAGVRDVLVMAWEPREGDKRLAAYFVASADAEPTSAGLRAFLRDKLPPYMVPAVFVKLDEMPLTANGKIDRKAVPVPSAVEADAVEEKDLPQDDLERQLTAVWEAVMEIRPIGREQSFFDLGGHSILAVRMMHGIEKSLGRKLPITALLEAPTVAGLAELLRRENWKPSWSSLVPIQPRGDRTPFFCVHGIGGTVLRFRELATVMGTIRPFYGLQAIGLDGGRPCPDTIEQIAAAYLTDVRRAQPRGPYLLGGYSFGGFVAVEMARQLRAAGETVALLAMLDTFPGKPETGRELIVKLLRQPLKEQLEYVSYRLPRLAGYLKRRAKKQLPPDLLAVRRALAAAEEHYELQRDPGTVTVFLPRIKSLRSADDPLAGWGDFAATVDIQEIAGRHDDMFFEPNVRVLAQKLNAALDRADAANGKPN
jgi:aspartate racemase